MSVKATVLGFNGENAVEGVSNVLEALEKAGYSPEVSIRLNGESVESPADTPVQEGDTIVATAPELKGGASVL